MEICESAAPETNIPLPKTSGISLTATPKIKKEKREKSTLSEELQTLLSSLYMDAKGRLHLNYPLRCAEDLAFCHSQHYSATEPERPCHTQASNLKCAWKQGRYVEFIQTASDMCVRCEFPGEAIFAKLIELILTTSSPKQAYVSIIRVFRLFIHTLPPCWLSMRKHYNTFFRKSIYIRKLATRNSDSPLKSQKVFDMIFTLIESTFDDYVELLKNVEDQSETLTSSQLEMSNAKSQCFTELLWEDLNGDTDSFFKLKSDARLERINVVLELLLEILEIDMTMWLLHHHRTPKDFIFDSNRTPLVVIVFEMTEKVRLTNQVKRLFAIFSRAIAMQLSSTHIKIIERYIALVMIASHTADIEFSIMGIRYPSLKDNTKNLIKEFYKTFKSYNRTSLDVFLNVIDMLRIPFVRYEFIDNFLKIFHNPSSDVQMSPAKVVNDLVKKVWTKYKIRKDVADLNEEISREQYFELLLKALYAYSEMYGLDRVMRYIAVGEIVRPLQTVSNSIHHTPNRGHPADVFLLEKMEEDIDIWIKQLRMQVRISRPKIDFPKADMCIDKTVLSSYRNDLKHCWILSDIIDKMEQSNSGINAQEWRKFSIMFKSETAP